MPVRNNATDAKRSTGKQSKGESGHSENDGESDSSEDSESEDEVVVKPLVKKAKSPANQEESSDNDEDDDDDNSEYSSSDDEVGNASPTHIKKSKHSAENVSSDEDDGTDGTDDESEDDVNEDKGFTDENVKWLKPKTSKSNLMSSDDGDEFTEQESDDENMLEVERQSRLIDAEMQQEQEEAELELRHTIAQQTSVFHLPTVEELQDDENRVVPPSDLRARIEDILEVLADFKVRREPGRSRSEYIERLGKDMAELFGYLQELVDYFLAMFGPNECFEFLEASDKPRPLVVRVNTLKARRKDLASALMKRGVRLDPLAPSGS